MPAPTPAASGDQPPDGILTIPNALGSNIRAYRLLNGLEQEDIAARMQLFTHPWHRATVSEVERARRNVTVAELLALVLILDVSVTELLDPRGPGGRWGNIYLGFPTKHASGRTPWQGLAGPDVSALTCPAEGTDAPRRVSRLTLLSHDDLEAGGADEATHAETVTQ